MLLTWLSSATYPSVDPRATIEEVYITFSIVFVSLAACTTFFNPPTFTCQELLTENEIVFFSVISYRKSGSGNSEWTGRAYGEEARRIWKPGLDNGGSMEHHVAAEEGIQE